MFSQSTMQLPFKKTVEVEFIKMFIEDSYGLAEVLAVSEKNFGKESANSCSQSTGQELNLTRDILAKAYKKIYKDKKCLIKMEIISK